jgi:uncharacterized protein
VVIDVWMQHPTLRFIRLVAGDMFAPLRRWIGAQVPEQAPDIAVTVAVMDAAGVDFGLLSACSAAHHQEPLIGNDDVAAWVNAHPDRFAGLAAVNLDRSMGGGA